MIRHKEEHKAHKIMGLASIGRHYEFCTPENSWFLCFNCSFDVFLAISVNYF